VNEGGVTCAAKGVNINERGARVAQRCGVRRAATTRVAIPSRLYCRSVEDAGAVRRTAARLARVPALRATLRVDLAAWPGGRKKKGLLDA
jgi:hypothetical protein